MSKQMIMRIIQLNLIAMATIGGTCDRQVSVPYQRVYVLKVTKQEQDLSAPWQSSEAKEETHLATCVGNNLFLTTAFAARRAVQLEMKRFEDAELKPATLVLRDRELNLALIKTQDEKSFPECADRQVVKTDSKPSENVTVVAPKGGGKVELRPANISAISQRSTVTSSFGVPTLEVAVSDHKSLGWSEPVFFEGELAGIAAGATGDSITAIAGSAIKHFLDMAARGGDYAGIPSLGVQYRRLISPTYRKLLGVDTKDGGVVVTAVHGQSSSFGTLELEDVLISVNGNSVDAQGQIQSLEHGRIDLSFAIAQKDVGEAIKIVFVRKGQKQEATITLKRVQTSQLPIPDYRDSDHEPYLVVGGFVFVELSRSLIESEGREGVESAPPEFLVKWKTKNTIPESGTKRWVVLQRVLGDETTRGFESQRGAVVESINGKTVASLEEFESELQTWSAGVDKDREAFAKIQLELDGGELILRRSDLSAAKLRIGKNFSLPNDARVWMP
jgi:S1-C subfamily serine protease